MAITWRTHEGIDRLRQKHSGCTNITSTFLSVHVKNLVCTPIICLINQKFAWKVFFPNNVLFKIIWYTNNLPRTEWINRVHLVFTLARRKHNLFFAAHLHNLETTPKSRPGDNSGTSYICRITHDNAAHGWEMNHTSNSLLRLVFFFGATPQNMPHAANLGCRCI